MPDKLRDITGAVVCLLSVSVFLIAGIQWQVTQHTNKALGTQLYFMCLFSAFYAAMLVCFIVAKGWRLKAVSSTGCSVAGVAIYQQARYHDRAWDNLDYISLLLAGLIFFGLYCLIDKYKKSNGYGN